MTTQAHKNIMDMFVDGARRGFTIAATNLLPNMVMTFVTIQALKIVGLLDWVGHICELVMVLRGLLGEVATVLLAALISMGGVIGVAASLATADTLTGHDVIVLLPVVYLVGNPVQNVSRCLGAVGVNARYYPHVITVCVINALLSVWVMQLIVQRGVTVVDYTAAGSILLQGVHLYTPEDRGIYDVFVANDKVIAVASNTLSDIVPDCTIVDFNGQILYPDSTGQHVHLIGGGGEASPTTHTPEAALNCLTEVGVTSMIGLLGTDSIPRHPESLLARTHALSEEGVSAWMLTGAYHTPSRTITGSAEKDMAIVDRVIGMKCAISDHRSAASSVYYLANIAAESRVGGLFGGKPGVTVSHMDDSKKASRPIHNLLENYDVPISKLLPTHVNRNVPLFEQALRLARRGGTIDITSSIDEPVVPAEGIVCTVQTGIPLARVTLNSDGSGSQPFFDNEGNLIHIGVAGFETLLEAMQVLVRDYGFSISDTLRPLTSSVADFLNLSRRGEILPGNDADLLVVTPELRIEQIYARGKLMAKDNETCVKGTLGTA